MYKKSFLILEQISFSQCDIDSKEINGRELHKLLHTTKLKVKLLTPH